MKRLAILCLSVLSAAFPASAQQGDNIPIPLTRHLHAKKGEWEIAWYANASGAYVEAEMIRSYPNNTSLRMVWGSDANPLNAIDFYGPTEAMVQAGQANVTWYFGPPNPGSMMATTAVIHPDNNGDLWLRINQRTDEPGAEDALSNSDMVTFHSGTNVWQFDLKGSNAAYKAFVDLYQQMAGGGAAPAPLAAPPVAMAPGGFAVPAPVAVAAPAPPATALPAPGGRPAGAGVPGEHPYANSGDWRVTFANDNAGAFSHTAAARDYPDGSSLRLVVGKNFQAIDFRGDFSGVQSERIQVNLNFDTLNLNHAGIAEMYGAHENDDVWLRVAVRPEDVGIGEGLANCNVLTISSGPVAWRYDLRGSKAALTALLNCYNTFNANPQGGAIPAPAATATAIPAPASAPAIAVPAPAMAVPVPAPAAVPAPGSAAPPANPVVAERIELQPTTPSTRWDVAVPANQTKPYIVPVIRGQQLSVKYLEDSRLGTVDFGKYSLEEGLDLGLEMTVDQSQEFEMRLTNPTGGPLVFTIYLTRE